MCRGHISAKTLLGGKPSRFVGVELGEDFGRRHRQVAQSYPGRGVNCVGDCRHCRDDRDLADAAHTKRMSGFVRAVGISLRSALRTQLLTRPTTLIFLKKYFYAHLGGVGSVYTQCCPQYMSLTLSLEISFGSPVRGVAIPYRFTSEHVAPSRNSLKFGIKQGWHATCR